jgi:hypothetical protein
MARCVIQRYESNSPGILKKEPTGMPVRYHERLTVKTLYDEQMAG